MHDRLRRARRGVALVLVTPALVVVAVLALGPLVQQTVTLLSASMRDGEFDAAVWHTFPWQVWLRAAGLQLGFVAAALALQLPFGVLLALAWPRRGWLAWLLVPLALLPIAAGPAVLDLLRLELLPRLWQALAVTPRFEAWLEFLGYVLTDTWRYVPLVALIARTAIPLRDDVDAAARIDGLGPLARLRHVHAPRLRRVLFVIVVLRVADLFAAWPHHGPCLARLAGGELAPPHAALASLLTLALLLLALAWPLRAAQRGGQR